MTIITSIDPADIQIVDLPAAFPNAEQAVYAWAQHRGITEGPVLGYAILMTDKTGNEPVQVVGLYPVTEYGAACGMRNTLIRSERDAMLQFHESVARYAFRVANVYSHGGKPTIVL